jgi:hypothetical protein
MNLPFRFPDPREDAVRRAREFQQLSPEERVRQLADVIETGHVLLRHSPNREIQDSLFQQREAEWQRVQRELFIRHGV